jgi:hypothetical protein
MRRPWRCAPGTIGADSQRILLAREIWQVMLTGLKITSRETVLDGKSFGAVGAYEALNGHACFAINPEHERNKAIVDLNLAPVDDTGKVIFRADVHLLKPVDVVRGNGTVFYNVVNRGRKGALTVFNLASGSNKPEKAAHFGDGFLLREGYTIAACGWQADVPPHAEDTPHLLTLDAPKVDVTGPVSCEIVVDAKTDLHSLGSRYHHPYEPVEDGDAVLTVRAYPYDEPEDVDREQWAFDRLIDGRAAIRFTEGFEPGLIYNLVYTGQNPKVMGTGFAATRDFLSFLKYETDGNPLGDAIQRVYSFGSSQSGRFLRHMLYEGFNEDETGRQVMDGVFANVAGGARGSFNHRFAQPSRHASAHFDALYPTEWFPFTDLPQTDSETGEQGGLLDRCDATGVTPRIFYTNTSTEYWNRASSLSHTDVMGEVDVDVHPLVRIYHFASAKHGPGDVPQKPRKTVPPNPVNFRYAQRALLVALDRWVREDVDPPKSRYGHIADGTLVDAVDVEFPIIPNLSLPVRMRRPLRLDWGDRWGDGIIDLEPPVLGSPLGVRVPQVDEDGNEVAGIRMPEVVAALGTFTGWRFRANGATDALAGLDGMWVPFARDDSEREGDSRRSISERYRSREEYLGCVVQAALALVEEQLMLYADVGRVVERAGAMYDWVMSAECEVRLV